MLRNSTPIVSLQAYASYVRTIAAQHALHQYTWPSCMLSQADAPFLQRFERLTKIELFMHVVIRPASWLASNREQLGQ